MENLVLVRIDYEEKDQRKKDKTMEFKWKPFYDIDNGKTEIFTHITYGHYSLDEDTFPSSRDLFWNYQSISDFNEDKVYKFFAEKVAKWYKSNHILFLYGDDFTFKNASRNYSFADSLVETFKISPQYKDKIKVFYSSPKNYFNELNKSNINFPELKNLDFYPYRDQDQDIWTGYFTSRPYFKGLVRDTGNYLLASSRLILNLLVTLNRTTKSFNL